MEQEIRQHLQSIETVGSTILYFDTINSTNTCLKEQVQCGAADGTVVIAGHQTAGRGRMTRSFESPEGKGIYLSVLLRPKLPPERLLPLTALAGIAVCDAVERVCGVRPGVKWPNDAVLNGKKLCGILTELVMDGAEPCIVLGVGVNLSQTAGDFSPEVAAIATSLSVEVGKPVGSAALIAALLEEIDRLYIALKREDLSAYLAAYRRDCVNLGKQVQLIAPEGTREAAAALDVDEAFGLIVQTAEGTVKTVRAGEVSVRGLYGYIE